MDQLRDLLHECARALAQPTECAVQLTVPAGRWPDGLPPGQLMRNKHVDGRLLSVYGIAPHLVLRWLAAEGMLTIRPGSNGSIVIAPYEGFPGARDPQRPRLYLKKSTQRESA